MSRFLQVGCLGLLYLAAAVGSAAVETDSLEGSPRERYAVCTALAADDPERAEALAATWRAARGGPPAGHCLALALAGQSRYADAARTLDEIANEMRLGGYFFSGEERADRELLGEIFGQAGNAWILAGQPQKAYQSLTEAVGITPVWSRTIVEHYIDRARALAMLGNYEQALNDLAVAAERDPERIEVHVFRASALRKLERYEAAAAELEAAFALSEEHQEALLERANLRHETGDTEGAIQDWIKLVRRHPDSPAAGMARRNLEAAEVDVEAWKGIDEVDVTGKRRRPER